MLNKNVVKYDKEWRKCSKCKKQYPATTEFFSPQKIKIPYGDGVWYGLRPDCKICRATQGRIAHHKKKGHYTETANSETKKKKDIPLGGMGLV
jgi:hypothetical protein